MSLTVPELKSNEAYEFETAAYNFAEQREFEQITGGLPPFTTRKWLSIVNEFVDGCVFAEAEKKRIDFAMESAFHDEHPGVVEAKKMIGPVEDGSTLHEALNHREVRLVKIAFSAGLTATNKELVEVDEIVNEPVLPQTGREDKLIIAAFNNGIKSVDEEPNK